LAWDLGWRAKGQLNERFAAAAFADGTWLASDHARGPAYAPLPEFAAVKDRLRALLVRHKAQELGRSLRDKAEIIYLAPDLQPELRPAAASAMTGSGETAK
jgi:hypothetical protein